MISRAARTPFSPKSAFELGDGHAGHLCRFASESALSESSSKSAYAFPATSSAALVRASSAVSFSFSRRSRSFSTASVLRPGRPAGLSVRPFSVPALRAFRQPSI